MAKGNPYHRPAGPGGGQFTSGGTGGYRDKSGTYHPFTSHEEAGRKARADRAARDRSLAAAGDRTAAAAETNTSHGDGVETDAHRARATSTVKVLANKGQAHVRDMAQARSDYVASETSAYNRDLKLRIRDRQVGSGMKHRP